MLYSAYGSKEKTNTGWKFYINKMEKQSDKAKKQLYKFVAYNIKWNVVCVWSQSSCMVTYVIS